MLNHPDVVDGVHLRHLVLVSKIHVNRARGRVHGLRTGLLHRNAAGQHAGAEQVVGQELKIRLGRLHAHAALRLPMHISDSENAIRYVILIKKNSGLVT